MRHEIAYHVSLLDARLRIIEITSNASEMVHYDVDLSEPGAIVSLTASEGIHFDPAIVTLVATALANPEVALRLGFDFTISGWYSTPDEPPSAYFDVDPDPGSGMALRPKRDPVAIH